VRSWEIGTRSEERGNRSEEWGIGRRYKGFAPLFSKEGLGEI